MRNGLVRTRRKEKEEEELLQQNFRICFLSLSLSLSLFPPTTFLVPSFNVQMIFFIASAGNKLKSERARKEADAERANETRCDIKKSF